MSGLPRFTVPKLLTMLPELETTSVPVPALPTLSEPLSSHCEPLPSIVAVPVANRVHAERAVQTFYQAAVLNG